VSSPPKVPLPLSVSECSAVVGAVRLGRPIHRDVPSPWAHVRRAPWALGPALGPNVGRLTSRLCPEWSWVALRVAVGRASASQAGRAGTVQLGHGGFGPVAFDLYFYIF
jgi:hypothetical protein